MQSIIPNPKYLLVVRDTIVWKTRKGGPIDQGLGVFARIEQCKLSHTLIDGTWTDLLLTDAIQNTHHSSICIQMPLYKLGEGRGIWDHCKRIKFERQVLTCSASLALQHWRDVESMDGLVCESVVRRFHQSCDHLARLFGLLVHPYDEQEVGCNMVGVLSSLPDDG